MGSASINLFHLGRFCTNCSNNDIRTETRFKEYEDEHIKVSYKSTREIVNGRTTNKTDSHYIYNKDGYYKPQQLLASGKDYD